MDVLSNLGLGFAVALTLQNIAYCFIGVLLGTIIGVLPGIGPVTTVAMLLPISFTLAPESALILLAGIYYGAQYGGSTTAILVNIPGEASSVVTTIDGHQMARQGRAGPALGIAAIGSFFAGCVSTLLIAFAAPPLAAIALQFGPAEYFSLMVCGLIAAVVLAHGSLIKAIARVVLGLLLGLVGTDVNSGSRRFNFGMTGLADGIEFVALSMAIYGIAEVAYNLEQKQESSVVSGAVGRVWPSLADLKYARARSCAARRSAPFSACCREEGRCWRRSRPIRWRKTSPGRRATSAAATSGASRRPNPPTMPVRRPRSFPC
jgi:TctA family transporter